LSLLLASLAEAKEWAVLVAGSNSYGNYRHQADVCHAYQVAHKNGIPDSRIIVFQYDDLVNSSSNPFKGQIFNKPSTGPGVDVYKGCGTDYTGRDVTPANFIAALTGDATKSGGKKVLTSTSDDNVFVFFSDHGATGIIAFPTSQLSAKDLNNALKVMKDKKMFKKLVFYLEACESGSMFEGLVDPNAGIYVTTASSATESSWGTYCPPDDKVNGKTMQTCLGDLYSVNFLENSDASPLTETLQEQYAFMKKATTLSKVMQYGDLTYTSDPIGNFIGDTAAAKSVESEVSTPNPAGIVNSRDIPMHLAYYQYLRADQSDFATRQKLATELQKSVASRVEADLVFMKLSKSLGGDDKIFTSRAQSPALCGECCDTIRQVYADHCGGFDDYSLQYVRVVVNLCRHVAGSADGIDKIATAMKAVCIA